MQPIKSVRELEKAYERIRGLKDYKEEDKFFLDFLEQNAFKRLFENEEIFPYLETLIQFDQRDFRSISVEGEYPEFDFFFKWISGLASQLEARFEVIEPRIKELSLPYLREHDPFKHEFGKGELVNTKSALKIILQKTQQRESFEEIFPNETPGVESLRLFYFRCIQPLIEIIKKVMKPVYGDESFGGVVVIWRNLDKAEQRLKSICLASDEVAQSVVDLYRYYAFWKDKMRESVQHPYKEYRSEWKLPRNKLEKAFILTLAHLNYLFGRKEVSKKELRYFDLVFDFQAGRVWKRNEDKYDENFSKPFNTRLKGKLTKEGVFEKLLGNKGEFFNDTTVFSMFGSNHTGNIATEPINTWERLYNEMKKQIFSAKFSKISSHKKGVNRWIEYGGEENGIRIIAD